MDLLISMKAEPIEKGIEPLWKIMTMPAGQSGGYFIAEFREAEPDQRRFLKELAASLRDELGGDKDLLVETTVFGFMLKKKVDETIDYMEAWEKWVKFSQMMYEKLSDIMKELNK